MASGKLSQLQVCMLWSIGYNCTTQSTPNQPRPISLPTLIQLEGILYACSRHQEVLPSGERAGFFIGDGAGVGKGRQIAGCVLDNYARGRR